jgi:hypothetical protein
MTQCALPLLVLGFAAMIPMPDASACGAVPDFSGPWGRNMFNFEPPDSAIGPIVNLRRLGADAGRSVVDGDPVPLAGDDMNPILKPEAAAIVK